MTNFFINAQQNNFNLQLPYDAQESKEMQIHKIILYPFIEPKILTIKLVLIDFRILEKKKVSIELNILMTDVLRINNTISDNYMETITLFDTSRIYQTIFNLEYSQGKIELTNFTFNQSIQDEILKHDNYRVDVTYDGHLKTQCSDYNNLISKISIIPCDIIKAYISNDINTTIETNIINNNSYTNLITFKHVNTMPIEFSSEDFFFKSNINVNSRIYFTDENNQLIKVYMIYLFYSII